MQSLHSQVKQAPDGGEDSIYSRSSQRVEALHVLYFVLDCRDAVCMSSVNLPNMACACIFIGCPVAYFVADWK
jgi:hypothetical protein